MTRAARTDTLYRASVQRPSGREGECWTDELDCAEQYATADGARVWAAEADLSGVVWVEGYDHDEDHTPADDDEYRARHAAAGVTWIAYQDETEQGREMTCYRLVRDIELAAREVAPGSAGDDD